MNPGITFERVYLALKARIASGALAPGDHVEPAAIGRELGASITPVRDALHRLVGERLIEAPRHDGFRLPMPTEAGLRDLYRWNLSLLELALRRRPRPAVPYSVPLPPDPGEDAGACDIAPLYLAIAASAGSRELEAAVAAANDRLAPVRLLEARLHPCQVAEAADLRARYLSGDPALRRALAAYHRRRQGAVEALVALMGRKDASA